mgnify:CR=1 FL=1
MPRRALTHDDRPAEDDEIAARCREWWSFQQFTNGGELPAANQCPCGNPELSKVEVRAVGMSELLIPFPIRARARAVFVRVFLRPGGPLPRARRDSH